MTKNLVTTEKVMFEVKDILLNSPKLRRLVYFDSPDALTKATAPTRVEVEFLEDGTTNAEYITLFPFLQTGITEYGRNTYIMISLPSVDLDTSEDGNIYPAIFITAVTNLEHYLLSDSKLRLLQICDEIIKLIDNHKFSFATKAEVIKMEEVLFDNQIYGYMLKVFCSDITKKEKF